MGRDHERRAKQTDAEHRDAVLGRHRAPHQEPPRARHHAGGHALGE